MERGLSNHNLSPSLDPSFFDYFRAQLDLMSLDEGNFPSFTRKIKKEDFFNLLSPEVIARLGKDELFARLIMKELFDFFPHFSPEIAVWILRQAFKSVNKINQNDLEEFLADEASYSILNFLPNSANLHIEFLRALFESIAPDQEEKYWPELDEKSFLRHKKTLILCFSKLEEPFKKNDFGLNPDYLYPPNFLEFIQLFLEILQQVTLDKQWVLFEVKKILFQILDYITHPYKLLYLQAFTSSETGKILSPVVECFNLILNMLKQFLEGKINPISWEQLIQRINFQTAIETFPGVEKALESPFNFPVNCFQIKYKGRSFLILKTTITGKTKEIIVEDCNNGELIAVAIEQLKKWVEFIAPKTSLPIHYQFIIENSLEEDNKSKGRSIGSIFFTSTKGAFLWSNTPEGRMAHQQHETYHLELRLSFPNIPFLPFFEEGFLYALDKRPDILGFLKNFTDQNEPINIFEAIYGYWREKSFYGFAWLTMSFFLTFLEQNGVNPLIFLEEINNFFSGYSQQFYESPFQAIILESAIKHALKKLLPEEKRKQLWGEGDLALLTFQALINALPICSENLLRYKELNEDHTVSEATRIIQKIEKDLPSFERWCEGLFSIPLSNEIQENFHPESLLETLRKLSHLRDYPPPKFLLVPYLAKNGFPWLPELAARYTNPSLARVQIFGVEDPTRTMEWYIQGFSIFEPNPKLDPDTNLWFWSRGDEQMFHLLKVVLIRHMWDIKQQLIKMFVQLYFNHKEISKDILDQINPENWYIDFESFRLDISDYHTPVVKFLINLYCQLFEGCKNIHQLICDMIATGNKPQAVLYFD